MGDGERKSMEADGGARPCPNPEGVNAAHERLTYFTRGAEWSDRDVRREGRALRAGGDDGSGACNGLDHRRYGLPKQGTHSVGVQRQYSGTIGKIANCQVAASLTIATRTEHVPVDFALYLPRAGPRIHRGRAEAHIPDEVTSRPSPSWGSR